MSDTFFVKILNYQRIRKASLEFSPGLNVIVGESNNGKTSIYRSLATLLFNNSKDSNVSLGETKSAVGVKYNGHEVIWRRDNKAASPTTYRVDGKIYAKVGRNPLPQVSEVFGIREVELDEQKIRLNFQKQMEFPFLLDKTPSQLFKFIMQSAEEDNIIQVIKSMKKDLSTMSVNIKAYEDTREELAKIFERESQKYNEKKEAVKYCDIVLGLENRVKKVESLEELIAKAEAILDKIVRIDSEKALIKSKYAILDAAVTSLQDKMNDWKALADIVAKGYTKSITIKVINETNEGVKAKIESYKSLDGIKSKIDYIYESEDAVNEFSSLLTKVQKSSDKVNKASIDRDSIKEKLFNVENELSEFKVCPYCGSEL